MVARDLRPWGPAPPRKPLARKWQYARHGCEGSITVRSRRRTPAVRYRPGGNVLHGCVAASYGSGVPQCLSWAVIRFGQ